MTFSLNLDPSQDTHEHDQAGRGTGDSFIAWSTIRSNLPIGLEFALAGGSLLSLPLPAANKGSD